MDNPEKPTTLITGAGIGIGAATARAFADADYRVIVTDILEGEGRSVAGDIESGEAEYRHLDVTNTDEVDAVVSTVQNRYGPLHAVVANAGIAHRVPLTELTDEKWDHTHDVDLKGVMRVCRAAAPAVVRSRSSSSPRRLRRRAPARTPAAPSPSPGGRTLSSRRW